MRENLAAKARRVSESRCFCLWARLSSRGVMTPAKGRPARLQGQTRVLLAVRTGSAPVLQALVVRSVHVLRRPDLHQSTEAILQRKLAALVYLG